MHHVELGLFRPDWLTVEPDGAGPASRFPRDWAAIEALARGPEPQADRLWPADFLDNAWQDVAWNLTNLVFAPITHRAYRRHATWHPMVEYAGLLRQMATAGGAET